MGNTTKSSLAHHAGRSDRSNATASVQHINPVFWARDVACQGGVARAILLYLASRRSPDGLCFPSTKRIAADTGWARSTVCEALKSLEEQGLIRRKQRRVGKTRGLATTQYDLLMGGVFPTLAREADNLAREADKVAREPDSEGIYEEKREEDPDLPLQGNLKTIDTSSGPPDEPADPEASEVITPQDALSIKNFKACSPAVRAYRAYVWIAQESGWPAPAPLTRKQESTLYRAIRRIGGIQAWIDTLTEVQRSDWLRGKINIGWVPDLIWLLNNSRQIRSGKYRNRSAIR